MRVTPIIYQQKQRSKEKSFKASMSQTIEAIYSPWKKPQEGLLKLVAAKAFSGIGELLKINRRIKPVDIKLGQRNPELHTQKAVKDIDDFLNIPYESEIFQKEFKSLSEDIKQPLPKTFGEILKNVLEQSNVENPEVLTLEVFL